jgi:hypothetical protein
VAKSLQLDEYVFVPSHIIPGGERQPYSIYRAKVVAIEDRKVRIVLPDGQLSALIASSKVHRDVGIAIVSIGDFSTEDTLIVPLAKSALQFFRLLLPEDHISAVRVRAIGELSEWWSKNHAAYTHIILIGHGSSTGLTFGVGGERNAATFQRRLGQHGSSAKIFLSLCCETGRRPFASEFSSLPLCESWIAPHQSIHGAVASQFLQTFFSLHLLKAESTTIAFKHANAAIPGQENFRLWRAGKLVRGKK